MMKDSEDCDQLDFFACLSIGITDWSIDWLIDWFINRSIYWLIDNFIDWLINRLIHRWIDLLIDIGWLIDWFIERKFDWLNYKLILSIAEVINELIDKLCLMGKFLIGWLFAYSLIIISFNGFINWLIRYLINWSDDTSFTYRSARQWSRW